MENISELVNEELKLIERGISHATDNSISIIHDVSQHIISSGGKKLRPLTVLLSAKCFDKADQEIIELATVIEFFHISSLLHDDVIDDAKTRRNIDAAHVIWGNKASILVGDYIFSKAFQLLAKINNQRVLALLADTSNIITQGEVKQLLYVNSPEVSIDEYMEIIHHKTAALFEAAAQVGPILADAEEEDIIAMSQFGYYLGRAFQITDDILDYSYTDNTLGKSIGNDLKEGKMTIPLIYAMQNSNHQQKQVITKAIVNSSYEDLDNVIEVVNATKAIELSKELASNQIDHALTHLYKISSSEYRDGLEQLSDFILSRVY